MANAYSLKKPGVIDNNLSNFTDSININIPKSKYSMLPQNTNKVNSVYQFSNVNNIVK